ncbi:hypothetical protein F4861DRAFT_535904 [Xylaria intraflava]|nr:hypothetical protein F4861DRAFT_535904 [Xylaria intraflava]
MAASTNPAEVQHQRSYLRGGRFQHLAVAIENSRILDRSDFSNARIYLRYGVQFSYRTITSLQGREEKIQVEFYALVNIYLKNDVEILQVTIL